MAPGDHILPAAADFTHTTRTGAATATLALGGALARLLTGGEVVLLHGDLGAGKTCLVQGICAELAVDQEVVSPTFTLVNTYDGRLRVHHLDFYRVEPGHDLDDIGVSDILDEIWDGAAVGLIEWPAPLVGRLAGTPYLELLACVGDGPEMRDWHLRGVPAVPPPFEALFPPRKDA